MALSAFEASHPAEVSVLKKLYVLVFGAYGGYAWITSSCMTDDDLFSLIRYLKEEIGLVLASWLGVVPPVASTVLEGECAWEWMTEFMSLVEKVHVFFIEGPSWDDTEAVRFFQNLVLLY